MKNIHLPTTAQVLAVDDNAGALASLSDMLHELIGRPPLTASSYASAVEVLKSYKPKHNDKVSLSSDELIALVVLDQDLSQANEDLSKVGIDSKEAGLHLITRVRSLAPLAAVGMITAYKLTEQDLAFEAGQGGADFYLSKSVAERSKAIEKLTRYIAGFEQRVEGYNGLRGNRT